MLVGCAAKSSSFYITDYRPGGGPQRYHETFDEGYYALGEDGNVDIVLRRESVTETPPRHTITQVIHLRTVWRSIPGRTVADASQINGTVSYYVVTGQVGAAFEGAGSLFFSVDPQTGVLTGSLDRAHLQRTRRLAAAHDLFRKAELSGRFRAVRDPRRVTRMINEMNGRFGTGAQR